MSQLGYSLEMTTGLKGQRADAGDVDVRSYKYPRLAQITTATVGGTATAGDYEITITDPRFGDVVVSFTRTTETSAQIADGLVAAILAEQDLNGVCTAEIGGAAEDVVITFLHTGIEYAVATSAPAPGTLVAVETQSAVVANLNLAICVKLGGADDELAILESGDGVGDVIGIVERPIGQLENTQADGNTDTTEDTFGAGRMIPVGRRGRWLVEVETAVTPASTPFVRAIATGSEIAGSFRDDADSGDAFDASSIFRFLSSADAGGLAIVEARIS